ncbi:TetR/AcrR family transcriptional regulator [Leifsonia sp. F6_8S_P_1B]|uniref:TetR/AcrR family transcriptional regulator n=1 Tax=Leifsonia williamsii TaxID=3035919 RepID=A0ABT8K9G7_9MICO|nr:TetR/AcrR family transcriptional regulator [Leifsonia williamsii]MDN4614106.1 TetR/AcrR family transcriptional regulator [Leifsonia williamsii]
MTTAIPTERRPRADAERNRRRVLDAAMRVFAEHGPSATLGDVARAAGVGIGTIYRKFPDKQALLDALFEDKIDTIMGIVEEAALRDDPGEAFRGYLHGMIELHAHDRSLATVLFGPERYDRFPPGLRHRLGSTADRLIADAVAAGELRPGFTRQDTIALAVMVSTISLASRDTGPELWRRYASIVVDGTRPSAGSAPLAPEPPDFRAMTEALSRVL